MSHPQLIRQCQREVLCGEKQMEIKKVNSREIENFPLALSLTEDGT